MDEELSRLQKDLDILKKKYPDYYFRYQSKEYVKTYGKKYKKNINSEKKQLYASNRKIKKYFCEYCMKNLSTDQLRYHLKSQKHIKAVKENQGLELNL